MTRLRSILVAAGIAAVVLVPLYGDPRQAPVTHPEWARMLLRALDLEQVAIEGGRASLVFQSLAWRSSARYGTDHYHRSSGLELETGTPRALLATASPGGEVSYLVAASRAGDYRLRLRCVGNPDAPIGVELRRSGETAAAHTLSVPPVGLVDTPVGYLQPGLYTMSLGLPVGTRLETAELIPPCVNPIEPAEGWRPTAITTTGDVAVTALKALDLEHELPPAATPIEIPGAVFQPATAVALPASLDSSLEGFWLKASADGLQAYANVDLPEAGLYTVYAFGLGGAGQSWVADSCHKAVLCPASETPEAPRWRPVLTTTFAAGPHSLLVTLGNGAGVQRLRIERKKGSVEDYLGTLARLGLDLGEAQRPILRREAVDAMNFVDARRRQWGALGPGCAEPALPAARGLTAQLAQYQTPQVPGQPLGSGTGPGPVAGPVLPIDLPEPPETTVPVTTTPVTAPPTTAPPSTSPPPTTVPPTVPTTEPSPPVVTTQPPATPVTPTLPPAPNQG